MTFCEGGLSSKAPSRSAPSRMSFRRCLKSASSKPTVKTQAPTAKAQNCIPTIPHSSLDIWAAYQYTKPWRTIPERAKANRTVRRIRRADPSPISSMTLSRCSRSSAIGSSYLFLVSWRVSRRPRPAAQSIHRTSIIKRRARRPSAERRRWDRP